VSTVFIIVWNPPVNFGFTSILKIKGRFKSIAESEKIRKTVA